MKVLIVDCYDSFTFNLYQQVGKLGGNPVVMTCDTPLERLKKTGCDRIILSPGPGTPHESGVCPEVLETMSRTIPTLGVCLGHQVICSAFGGEVIRANHLMHGKTSRIQHDGKGIFTGIPAPFIATRYHSLVAGKDSLPRELKVSATSLDDGYVMGVRHSCYPIEGLQFHPESILSQEGDQIIRNFLTGHNGGIMIFTKTLTKLAVRQDLTAAEAAEVMRTIMEGRASQAQIGAFLLALRMKGETAEEIAAFAHVMRDHAITVKPVTGRMLVDTCGTGGDGAQTFNISTASAFVAAGAGCPVVKHGNRGVSSRCGSADVLTALGVNLATEPEVQEHIVEKVGIAFFYAPQYHPAMKHIMTARREIGCRTVFNILGPLVNPAGAQAQILGVYCPGLTGTMADVLRILGISRAMVVHGSGLDEITTTGETVVAEVDSGAIQKYTIRCETFGIEPAQPSDLKGGDAQENARIIRDILQGERGAARDIVLMNAGAAIYVGGLALDLHEGIVLATSSIDSGNASARLSALVDATRGVA